MKNILTLFALLSCYICYAQQELKQTADDHFANSEWQLAVDSYQNYLKKNKTDSSALYNTGFALFQLEKYEPAIKYFDQAESNNFNSTFTTIGKTRSLIGLEKNEEATATLLTGAKNGVFAYMRLKNDPEFDPLRAHPDFEEALKLIKLNAYPCLSSENYRHFDFWLGEWDVYVNGQKVGDNSITMANGGCAIHEDYTTGNRNYTGQSINFYDPIDKKWHQHWVGSSGDVYNYIETDRAEGMLQFESKFMTRSGQITMSRLTFTLNEDRTVRQLFESSTDEGETWTPAFDGLYKKKK